IYVFAQIVLQLAQKIFAVGAILCALRGVRVDPFEIIASDEEITGETATVFERIARSFGQFERFALALRHLRSVDHGSRRWLLGLCARFLSPATAGFFRRFERAFHGAHPSVRA